MEEYSGRVKCSVLLDRIAGRGGQEWGAGSSKKCLHEQSKPYNHLGEEHSKKN